MGDGRLGEDANGSIGDGGADPCIWGAVDDVSFRNSDNGLLELPRGESDMRTLVWREIEPARIGSLQSSNGPYTTDSVGDAVMVDDGLLRFRGTSRRAFCNSGGLSRYHALGAPRMDV